jgi:hypothetical protein
MMMAETLLERARRAGCCESTGTANEINCKGLLALNLRKLEPQESLELAPRLYVLLPREATAADTAAAAAAAANTGATTAPPTDEISSFIADFKLSRALAVLKRVTVAAVASSNSSSSSSSSSSRPEPEPDEPTAGDDGGPAKRPEGLWGRKLPRITWEPSLPAQPIGDESISVALTVVRRCCGGVAAAAAAAAISVDAAAVSSAEWAVLRTVQLECAAPGVPTRQQQLQAAAVLAAVPARYQLSLLYDNLWLLKPSLNGGGNGRGILLLDQLPDACDHSAMASLLLGYAAAVGRSGTGGINDAKHGCVLQKAVENPHLIDRGWLLHHCPSGDPLADSDSGAINAETAAETVPDLSMEPPLFKYNWRVWVLASLSATPSAWLHKEGYIDLAGAAFTRSLAVPGAHVTNQLRGDETRGRATFQRCE